MRQAGGQKDVYLEDAESLLLRLRRLGLGLDGHRRVAVYSGPRRRTGGDSVGPLHLVLLGAAEQIADRVLLVKAVDLAEVCPLSNVLCVMSVGFNNLLVPVDLVQLEHANPCADEAERVGPELGGGREEMLEGGRVGEVEDEGGNGKDGESALSNGLAHGFF